VDTSQQITHALDRLGFGPGPGDRIAIERTSPEAYIQAQLTPTPEPAFLSDRLQALSDLKLAPGTLFERYAAPQNPTQAQQQNARLRRTKVLTQTEQSRVLRALASPNQLQEVMVDFWFNHFNVFVGKQLTMLWVGDYEQAAIRPHALGKFRDLLGATARHPAMLYYLDNWRNSDPNSPTARGQFKGLNENYARELLELHTLGVNGGYSQADVENLARVLTGWSIVSHRQPSPDESGFVFVAERHASGNKALLGTTIPSSGIAEGEAALDLLAQHPMTARHISYKLAQHFIADVPPEPLVTRLADRFLSTEGDIAAVLQTLFESDEFWQPNYYQQKFRTPYQYVLSLARAMGLGTEDSWFMGNPAVTNKSIKTLKDYINQLGMPLYRCRTPDGYGQVASSWLSPDAMLRRVSLTMPLSNINRDLRPDSTTLLATLGSQFSPEALSIIESAPPHQQAALVLGSPEMMYR